MYTRYFRKQSSLLELIRQCKYPSLRVEKHTRTTNAIRNESTGQKENCSHKILTRFEKRKLDIVDVHALRICHPSAFLLINVGCDSSDTFLIVLFMAPVTPELQCDPKLMHEIKKTAKSFAASGGGFLVSFGSSFATSSEIAG